MPTDKPRVTFTVSQDTLDKIDDYRFRNKSKNQTQAILSLIEKGLSNYEKENPSDSDESEPEGTEKWLIDLLVKGGYIPARSPFTKSPPRAGFSFFTEFMRVCGAFSVIVVFIQKAGKTPKNQPMQHEMQHEKKEGGRSLPAFNIRDSTSAGQRTPHLL